MKIVFARNGRRVDPAAHPRRVSALALGRDHDVERKSAAKKRSQFSCFSVADNWGAAVKRHRAGSGPGQRLVCVGNEIGQLSGGEAARDPLFKGFIKPLGSWREVEGKCMCATDEQLMLKFH